MDLQDFIRENSNNLQQYMPQIDEDLIPAKEYAVKLNITPQTVINQLKSKRLDGIQIGKRWFVKVKKNDSDLRKQFEELVRENAELRTKLKAILALAN